MNRKITLTSVVSFVLVFCFQVSSSFAQDMKIGYVESGIILERMPEMRAVEQRLQNFADRKIEELSQLERELRQEIEAYQQRAGVISDQARQREEERLGRLDFEYRQSQNEAQREWEARRSELLAPLFEQIQFSINEVARQKGIDYVFSTSTRIGDPILLYINQDIRSEYNITDAVMRNLGI